LTSPALEKGKKCSQSADVQSSYCHDRAWAGRSAPRSSFVTLTILSDEHSRELLEALATWDVVWQLPGSETSGGSSPPTRATADH
jgi:hypothetical protein